MRFLSRRFSGVDDPAASMLVGGGWLRRVRLPLLAAVLITGLAVLCSFAASSVETSMQVVARHQLESVLKANVDSLEFWLGDQEEQAQAVIDDPNVKDDAIELLRSTADASRSAPQKFGSPSPLTLTQLSRNPHFEKLRNSVSAHPHPPGVVGWALLNSQGRVVASDQDRLLTIRLSIPRDAIQRLEDARPTVSRPFPCPVPLQEEGPLSIADGPIMVALAPLRDGVIPLGSFALLINPLQRYTEVLQVAQTGETGETYAFNRAGEMMSCSRFETQLREAGLLHHDPNFRSILNVSIRDPGVDLSEGEKPNLNRQRQPLTRMASHAIRRGTPGNDYDNYTPSQKSYAAQPFDNDLVGYRNYRGVTVVGVWTWLPDYDIGLASEISADEAYQPLHVLYRWLYVLLGLLVCGGLAILIFFSIAKGLQRRFSNAKKAVRQLGQYELEYETPIGRGGMGTVYRGYHRLLRRPVAIKVLEGRDADDRSVSRFEREVQLTSQLMHPNTIAIYDYGRTNEGTFFYVMELIEGVTIQDMVADDGPQPPARVIHFMKQVCGSLIEAHSQQLIHRDIKPANIIVSARTGLFDLVKLVDFGLVKEVDRNTVQLTKVESLTGTPLYMSPESIRNASAVDPRSDLYAVGAVGYYLLTGKHLFEAETIYEVCDKQLHTTPLRPSERLGVALPSDLEDVIMRCVAKEPRQRPQSAEELRKLLEQCSDGALWNADRARHWWNECYDPDYEGSRSALASLQSASISAVDTQMNSLPGDTFPGQADSV